MNTKPVYDQIEIDIAVGDPAFSDRVSLKQGTCVGVRYIDIDQEKRDQVINLSVETSSGDALIGKTDYRDYINSGGDYNGNFKPCNFDTKADIKIDLKSNSNIANNPLKGVLIFKIDQPCDY